MEKKKGLPKAVPFCVSLIYMLKNAVRTRPIM